MLRIDDNERSVKEKVLEEIMGLMDKHEGESLKGLKKPKAVEVSVTEMEPVTKEELAEEAAETPEDDAKESPEQQAREDALGFEMHGEENEEEEAEPSAEEKAEIARKYAKYFK